MSAPETNFVLWLLEYVFGTFESMFDMVADWMWVGAYQWIGLVEVTFLIEASLANSRWNLGQKFGDLSPKKEKTHKTRLSILPFFAIIFKYIMFFWWYDKYCALLMLEPFIPGFTIFLPLPILVLLVDLVLVPFHMGPQAKPVTTALAVKILLLALLATMSGHHHLFWGNPCLINFSKREARQAHLAFER